MSNNLESDFLCSYSLIRSTDQDVLNLGGPIDQKMDGLPTLKTTCNAVVMKMHDLDTSGFGKNFHNVDHWLRYSGTEDIVMGDTFPAHAIINVNGHHTAEDAAAYLNKLFNSDRERFPRSNGWHAIYTNGNSKMSLSDKDHPFFYYKNHKKINSKASRILVVVDLAGEGLNNRYVNVWGAACRMSSVREAVQRIGRTLRSTHIKKNGSNIFVPPSSHDTVYVITHEDFRSNTDNSAASTDQTIRRAFDFIINGKSFMASVKTIGDYVVDDDENADVDTDMLVNLGIWERVAMANAIGNYVMNGKNPRFRTVIKDAVGQKIKEAKSRYANAWAESAYSGQPVTCHLGKKHTIINGVLQYLPDGSPVMEDVFRTADAIDDLNKMMRSSLPDPIVGILRDEKIVFNHMDENDCIEWLVSKGWIDIVKILKSTGGDNFVNDVNRMRCDFGESMTKQNMDIRQLPIAIVDGLCDEFSTNFKVNMDDVRPIVMGCVASYLSNVKLDVEEDDLSAEGVLCTPQVTYHLREQKFGLDTRAYLMSHLINNGKLSSIRALLAR